MQGQEVADLGLGEKGSTGRSFMERFRLLLGLLIKYHTALGYSLLSLLTAGGERLLSSVVFQCPCSATWNLPYSLVFLLAPAWILFLLGFLFSTRAKWLMTGCCARRGGKEKPGKEKPGKEKPVKEENGKEKPGKKEKGKEKPGKEKPGKEENGKEKPEKKEKGKEKPGKEKPGEEEPGEEEPGQEEPGQEEPGQEEPGQEEPGQEEPGEEEPGQEEPGEEEPGEEEPGQEEPGEEEPGQEEPGEEEPGQEEPGEEEPGEEEPGQEEPGEEEPGQEEPRKACRNLGQRCSFTWTALLAPTIWIAVSLLGGGFCECAATGTTWISRRMCPDQEASCLQEVPMAPCQKEKPEKVQEILRELKALSQVIGWSLIVFIVLALLISTYYKRCVSPLNFHHLRSRKLYCQKKEEILMNETEKHATELAAENVKRFFDGSQLKEVKIPNDKDWEKISLHCAFKPKSQRYSILHN